MIICTICYNFFFVPYIPSTLQLPHVFNVKIDESIMLVDVSSYMAQWKLIGKKNPLGAFIFLLFNSIHDTFLTKDSVIIKASFLC